MKQNDNCLKERAEHHLLARFSTTTQRLASRVDAWVRLSPAYGTRAVAVPFFVPRIND